MAKKAESDAGRPPGVPADTTGDAALEGIGFAEAMSRLEAILRRIESEETDIDRLAEELKHAAVLLELCRTKIKRAEVEVTQILERLDG